MKKGGAMGASPSKGLSEQEFKSRLEALVEGKNAKIWLMKSNGRRLDLVFSVGVEQGDRAELFDHIGGYYLLGEGVNPDLVPVIHRIFSEFCLTHHAVEMPHSRVEVGVEHHVEVVHHHLPSQHRRMVMRYPYSAPNK